MADVFGKALMDFLEGKPKGNLLVRRDDNFVSEQRIGNYFSEYLMWPDYEREILKSVKGKMLDIGAGAGRHSLWLEKRSFDVTAIDISPLCVEVMKRRGLKKIKTMSVQGMSFPEKTFNTVLLMLNNFGMTGTVQGTKKMLKDLYKITAPDGIIISTMRDPLKTEEPKHFEYHEKNRRAGKPIGQVLIRDEYGGENSDWYEILLSSPKELEGLIKGTGWIIDRLVYGIDGMYGMILKKG